MVTARTPAPQTSAPAPEPRPRTAHTNRTPIPHSAAPQRVAGAPAVRLPASTTALPSQWVSTPGAPLPSAVRGTLERSFNYDLSEVRVHSDPNGESTAANIGARAFTYGNHIVLGPSQHATNLGLMAHETAHVIQQQGASTVQMSSLGDFGGSLEREAQQVSLAVTSGQSAVVQGRTGSQFIQADSKKPWWQRGIEAVGSGIKAVGSAIGDVTAGARNAAIKFFKDRAKSIPGYDLLAVILGRDPINQDPVERNAVNVIRGVAGLIPGGTQMFENLQKSGVIQRAYEWVSGEIDRLNITWAMISGAFTTFIGSLGVGDLLNPGGLWERARAIFGGPISRLLAFAASAGRKILEFIFEGALALGGSAAQRVLGIFRRIGATFGIIADDPVKFLGNLLSAAKGGFQRFADNIVDHLKAALFQWLFGALAGAGLKLPQKFDFMGIMSIVLQVLGLTYDRLRARLVKLVGETAVKVIEEGFAFLKIIVTQGLAAAWEKLLEFATGMVDTVIESIRNWVVTTIVKSAVLKLASMFNPVGAIIQAVIAIYNTVMFFIERAQQIAALVESILDSIDNIARGNLSAAIVYVEKTLARTLPVIISFLARLINLGGISEAIKDVIKKIQKVVDTALDRVGNWIKDKAGALVGGKKEKAGPDTRTPEQKMAALRTAVGQAQPIIKDPRLSRQQKVGQLKEIKTKHQLTALELVKDKQTPVQQTVHVRGSINPTYNGEGVMINPDFPPEPKVIIETTIGDSQPRQGFEEVLDPSPAGFQRAHLLGAGLGRESPLGIFHAPTAVNQRLQGAGIEMLMQEMHEKRFPGVVFSIRASSEPHPGTLFLKEVKYVLWGERPGTPKTQLLEIRITVTNNQVAPQWKVVAGEIDLDAMNRYTNQVSAFVARRRR